MDTKQMQEIPMPREVVPGLVVEVESAVQTRQVRIETQEQLAEFTKQIDPTRRRFFIPRTDEPPPAPQTAGEDITPDDDRADAEPQADPVTLTPERVDEEEAPGA